MGGRPAMRGRIPGTQYSPGQAYLSNQLAIEVNPRVTGAIMQAAEARRSAATG